VNLRHKILKARKIKTLLVRLSYTQIQNIINYVNERTSNSNIPLTKKTLKEDIITEDGKLSLETEVGIPIESYVFPKNYPEIK
ncbi:16814_t:CDS:2, partial [Dentiscutata erythropus]